jgi:hypothetical protein
MDKLNRSPPKEFWCFWGFLYSKKKKKKRAPLTLSNYPKNLGDLSSDSQLVSRNSALPSGFQNLIGWP